MDDDVYETADWLLGRLRDDEEVTYADVGAVVRTGFDIVARDATTRSNDISNEGIWFRVLAGGGADYRHTTVLDRDHLEDLAERAVRSATQLGQDRPSRFDAGSIHRGVHDGWAPADRLGDADLDAVVERLETARDDALGEFSLARSRVEVRGVQLDQVQLTTTDGVVRTSLDRIGVETTVVPDGGPKIRDHAGATTGARFLDRFDDIFDGIATRVERARAVESATIDGEGRLDVVLGPAAAASAFHHVSHFLERDTSYMGADPFAEGDEIAPESVTVDDVIRPGSWGAQAYDADTTPTQPVTLVEDGRVVNFMETVESAAREGTVPQGHAIPSIGAEHPPRIHARHLEIEAGSKPTAELLAGADIVVERFGEGRLRNEATRTKRASAHPPSVLYAKDVAEQTPGEYDEGSDHRIEFPIGEGYVVDDGERARRLDGGSVAFALSDLRTIDGLGTKRRTLTGVCEKHKSHLPYAVTAPAVRLETDVVQ